MTIVWIYVDTNKQVGDVDHLKVFATSDAANEWFTTNDTEGVAFPYNVVQPRSANDRYPLLLSSEATPQSADPLIGELTLTTDQGDIVLALKQEPAENLAEELTSFLDAE